MLFALRALFVSVTRKFFRLHASSLRHRTFFILDSFVYEVRGTFAIFFKKFLSCGAELLRQQLELSFCQKYWLGVH